MKFLSIFAGFAAFSASVTAFAIPDFDDAIEFAEHTLEKRAFLPVVGASGSVLPRFEVRQLASEKANQWTLFLLAMRNFQQQSQSTKGGYFQVSGIHGVPDTDWDGVGKCSSCTVAGYCPHSSILFLGWHRAYVALFEQQLVKVAKNIAKQYPASTRQTMVNAANQLRLPYWDWAAHPPNGGSNMPALVTNPQVTVNGPSGSVTFANPLHHHTFTNPTPLKFTSYNVWKNTLRYPTSAAASATSQEQKAIDALNNIRGNMQDQVYQMFSTCDEFVEVGSDAKGSSSVKCSNSIENIHNTIHTASGGPQQKAAGIPAGHMTVLPLAAFDPLFWLHHCNVDRLFAMWQAIYPNSYSGSQVAPKGTRTIPVGSTQNVNSPLTPFHKNAAGDFWTTTQVRNHKIFKYTYPEFADSNGSKSAIVSYVNKLYGPNAQATAGSSKRDAAPLPQSEPAAPTTTSSETSSASSTASGSASALASATVLATPFKADNGSLFQYVANIETTRFGLNGSYNIFLFNGQPTTDDSASWILDANLIGPMGVLAAPGQTDTSLVATGSVPLTRTLQDEVTNGDLPDLSEANVVPYLKKNLVWRIAGPSGNAVDPDSVPDFEIAVYASTATPPTEYELPSWSEFIPLAEITKSKAGGATPASITKPSESASA